MADFIHSVTLDKEKCLGCTNCIKRCPTQAIRVRKELARIVPELCIDCGECIRVCPHHAKIAVCDTLDVLDKYEYTVALPAPSLFAQFNNLKDTGVVIEGLLKLGFDDVFEVAKAAELVSDATRRVIASGEIPNPIISSACPTIPRLIRIRFPELIDHLLPLLTPAELAGKLAREKAMKKTGLPAEKIGTIFISPCPAKVSSVYMPIGIEKSNIDSVVSIKEVYKKLLGVMRPPGQGSNMIPESGSMGVSWGSSGGESTAILRDHYLAADGIENCINILNEIEDEQLQDVKFVELNACPGGCVGGVLTVKNPYIGKVKLASAQRKLPPCQNTLDTDEVPKDYFWDSDVEFVPVMQLDPDMEVAFKKMDEIEQLAAEFPGLDCGACGSPSCRSFAEDIVMGYSKDQTCIFMLRDEVQNIAESLSRLSSPLKSRKKAGGENK